MVAEERAEGWFTDSFGRHEARWMSDGSPTKLVRDGEEESYEEPPDEEPTVTSSRIAEEQAVDGSDLLRAGANDGGGPLNERLHGAGEFGSTRGSHIAIPPKPHEER
jgi:hypothetical protein